jgi:hypothetical protein
MLTLKTLLNKAAKVSKDNEIHKQLEKIKSPIRPFIPFRLKGALEEK